MGLDERLFQWLSNALRRRPSRAQHARALRGVLAEPQLARLRHIVAAVADESVDVAVVDGPPLVVGRLVLFPRAMDVGATPAENQELLLLLAAFAGGCIRQRLNARAAANDQDQDDDDVAALRVLVAARALEAQLGSDMPGYLRGRSALASTLLAGRAAPAQLSARWAALEHIARHRIDASASTTIEKRADVAEVVARAIDADEVDAPLLLAFKALGRRVPFVLPMCWASIRAATRSAMALSPAGDALPRGVTHEHEGRKRPPARRRRAISEHHKPDNPVTHSFEKVHTVEEYKGGQKRADGSDELADHAAGLDEIDLEETVLSSESAQSIYNAGALSGDVDPADLRSAPGLRYDEWDGKHRRYLPGFCRVQVTTGRADVQLGGAMLVRVQRDQRRAVQHARGAVLAMVSALRWRSRQIDGPDVDVDAAIDRISTLRAGHEGSRNVYLARRRSARELALLVLLDASLSTDAWVDNRRVLDVERDAAVILGLATEGLLDEVAVAAFSSDTHEDCRYLELKGFDEPWAQGAARLAALEPAGYTRLGPGIRHATSQLARCRAKRRLLVILTDGKPSDRDRYEGRHGESDVRQAIREAAQQHIDVLALGADPRATAALHAMCGRKSVAGLSQASDVAQAVASAIALRVAR